MPPEGAATPGSTGVGDENANRQTHHTKKKHDWKEVTARAPCPACGKADWCARTPEGLLRCNRTDVVPPGMRLVSRKANGALFAPLDKSGSGSAKRSRFARAATVGQADKQAPRAAQGSNGGDGTASTPRGSSAAGDRPSLAVLAEKFQAAMSPDRRAGLAADLGVTTAGLQSVGAGWATRTDLLMLRAGGAGWADAYPDGAYAFPERDGGGVIVGFLLRAEDGRKGSPSKAVGARRGLIIPNTLKNAQGPVLIVEGPTDVAAAVTLGLSAVGRPSNRGGASDLGRLLKGREVLVLGERDQKDDGAWPGRDGAERIAEALASKWDQDVPWSLPPSRSKDLREELLALCAAGLDLTSQEAVAAARASLLGQLADETQEASPEAKPKQSELIVRLALEHYRIGLSMEGDAFGVPFDGPNVAILFRGSKDALRAKLAKLYRAAANTVPSASALADALVQLEGEALECAPEPVHLRVADHGGGVVLDLGSADGAVVVIGPSGWTVVDSSPVLFRRTAAMGELPRPTRGGSLDHLRRLLNVAGSAWPLVVGWLVAAFLPSLPHPVLYLSGEHGTGKTSCAKYLVRLVDPGPAIVRTPPESPDNWAVTASASWAFTLDNLSHIPQWLSDAICKACTGDGWLKRALYTDSALAIMSFRRVLAITSIDAGSIRPDLADRMIIADLDRIPDGSRRTERALEAEYNRNYAGVLGALLDLVSQVVAALPSVKLTTMPRMADFAEVLAAMDSVLGTDALDLFSGQRDRLSRDVLEGDLLGAAILAKFEAAQDVWEGTAGDLLKELTPAAPPKGWPRNAKGLSGALRRLIPPLRTVGIEVIAPRPTDKTRRYIIRPTAQTAQPPEAGTSKAARGDSDRAVQPERSPNRPADRPPENAFGRPQSPPPGGSGDQGDPAITSPGDEEEAEWR